MSDLIERLRDYDIHLTREAADCIERLEVAVAQMEFANIQLLEKTMRLDAALAKIGNDERVPPWVRSVAHSALNRETGVKEITFPDGRRGIVVKVAAKNPMIDDIPEREIK